MINQLADFLERNMTVRRISIFSNFIVGIGLVAGGLLFLKKFLVLLGIIGMCWAVMLARRE